MSVAQVQTLLLMFIKRILDEVFPDETGAARMQQLALFTLIFALEQTGEPVTASSIAEMTGQKYSQIHFHLQKLLKIGVVERTRVKNRLRKGQAWHLTIKHTPQSEKLLHAIAGGKKGRGG